MLDSVHDSLKDTLEKRKDMMTSTEDGHGYVPPELLDVENVGEVVQVTNQRVADAALNNQRKEIQATSRQANLLMSMARDNHSATAPRLTSCRNYLLYLDRALREGDPEDPTDNDGMLLSSIKRVER